MFHKKMSFDTILLQKEYYLRILTQFISVLNLILIIIYIDLINNFIYF